MDTYSALFWDNYIWRNSAAAFGTLIFIINMAHMKKSSIMKGKTDSISFLKVIVLSIVKGIIYGITIPFSPVLIAINALDNNEVSFAKHFIPDQAWF
jgi:hypothetical protein